MTTITTTSVAPNELIESAWGNAVRTDLINLNAEKLELAGGTMTGALNLIAPSSAAHATRKDYVDNAVNGLLSASGGTVTGGSITIATSGQGVNLPSGEPSSASRAARKDYVDTQVATRLPLSGGTISGGSITIATSGQGINLPTGEPTSAARAARKDYVDTQVGTRVATSGDSMTGNLAMGGNRVTNLATPTDTDHAATKQYVDSNDNTKVNKAGDSMTGLLVANGGVVLPPGTPPAGQAVRKDHLDAQLANYAQKAGDNFSGNVTIGGPVDVDDAGVALGSNGGITSSTSVATGGSRNLDLVRFGSAANAGQLFATFRRGATTVGSIEIASGSSVSYNTTSDPRAKHVDGPADGALEQIIELGRKAFFGRWLNDDGEPDGGCQVLISAHDIEDVLPWAVSGERDAVDDDGNPVYMQAAFPSMVPTLIAAIAQLAGRVEVLETP